VGESGNDSSTTAIRKKETKKRFAGSLQNLRVLSPSEMTKLREERKIGEDREAWNLEDLPGLGVETISQERSFSLQDKSLGVKSQEQKGIEVWGGNGHGGKKFVSGEL